MNFKIPMIYSRCDKCGKMIVNYETCSCKSYNDGYKNGRKDILSEFILDLKAEINKNSYEDILDTKVISVSELFRIIDRVKKGIDYEL